MVNCKTTEDLMRYFSKQWEKNQIKKEFVLITENLNISRAYEKMTKTWFYANK